MKAGRSIGMLKPEMVWNRCFSITEEALPIIQEVSEFLKLAKGEAR